MSSQSRTKQCSVEVVISRFYTTRAPTHECGGFFTRVSYTTWHLLPRRPESGSLAFVAWPTVSTNPTRIDLNGTKAGWTEVVQNAEKRKAVWNSALLAALCEPLKRGQIAGRSLILHRMYRLLATCEDGALQLPGSIMVLAAV